MRTPAPGGALPRARHRLRILLSDRATLAQFGRFLAVGLLNSGFGYLVFALAILAGISPMPSLVLTYLLGVPFNFVTTGKLVFHHRGYASLGRFVVAYGVIYIVNVAAYHLIAAAGARPLVAQAICLPVMVVMAFILFKLHVFRPHSRPASGSLGRGGRSR